jgi:hypothetical protein
MNKGAMLEQLEKATDRAASFAIQRGLPVPVSKKSTRIGTCLIEKNKRGRYNITSFTGEMLYEDISLFDVAISIAQNHMEGRTSAIKNILYLQEKFLKYKTDMIHYLNCMKGAKRGGDSERFYILEDKFQVAEQHAKNVRDDLAFFKLTKIS